MMKTAGLGANAKGLDKITPELVRQAHMDDPSYSTDSKLDDLDKQKIILLLAIARCIGKDAYTTTGDAEEEYKAVCEEYNEKARGHTQVWTYMKDLDALGIIEAKKSGKGHAGKTTVISIPDITTKELKEKIEQMLASR